MCVSQRKNQKGNDERIHKIKAKWNKSIFSVLITAIAASITAILWCKKMLGGEEALALFTIIGGSIAGLRTLSKNRRNNFVFIVCIFFIIFGIVLFLCKIIISNTANNIENAVEETVYEETEEEQAEEHEKKEEEYVAKEFIYKTDVLFSDLVYYIDGHEIEKNDRNGILEGFIYDSLNCGNLPERYEGDSDKLNSGVYAEKTHDANEYYDCYIAVKDKAIERTYKIAFLRIARESRKDADEEYVTIENNINLVWACEAERTELGLCIAGEVNAEKIKEWEIEAKECNRDIMIAIWNVLVMEKCLGREINKDMAIKLIESYEWERDHEPEDGVDYNEIIDAFKNVLNE